MSAARLVCPVWLVDVDNQPVGLTPQRKEVGGIDGPRAHGVDADALGAYSKAALLVSPITPAGIEAAGDYINDREHSRRRHAIIAANPTL